MYRIFGHYIPRTMFIFGLLEALVLLVSVHLALLAGLHWGAQASAGQAAYTTVLLDTVFFISAILAAMFAMGLYSRDLRDQPRLVILRIALSFALGLLFLKALDSLLHIRFLDLNMQMVALACAFFGILASRLVLYRYTEDIWRRKTVILGTGEKAQHLQRLRRRTDNFGVEILGYVEISKQNRCYIAKDNIIQLRGTMLDYVQANNVKEIVVAVDDRRFSIPHNELLACRMLGVNVIEINTYLERQLGKIMLDTVHPSTFVYSDGFTHSLRQKYKRAVDILISLLGLVLSSPLMLVAAIAILLESRGKGSVLYRQQRVGAGGRVFDIFKFRSMCHDAEKDGVAVWASKNDDRVTRVGAFLRKTRIDELPQLVNVLKGDMSLVGPRPERPQIVEDLSQDIPYYSLRHYVKPGITGWAQICYPYGSSVEDARQKLQFDLYYMKNYSFFLDLVVLVQTVTVILWGKGAR